MNKEQVLKIVSEVLGDGFKDKLLTRWKADFLYDLSLALDKEEETPTQTMKDFARTIVEQSVPEECSCFENALAGHRCEFNACRSQTLSNADNLLK